MYPLIFFLVLIITPQLVQVRGWHLWRTSPCDQGWKKSRKGKAVGNPGKKNHAQDALHCSSNVSVKAIEPITAITYVNMYVFGTNSGMAVPMDVHIVEMGGSRCSSTSGRDIGPTFPWFPCWKHQSLRADRRKTGLRCKPLGPGMKRRKVTRRRRKTPGFDVTALGWVHRRLDEDLI